MRGSLTPLSEYRSAPRRLLLLPAMLTIPAVLWVLSMPLPWHHHDIPGDGFIVLFGYNVDSWLIIAALVAVGFAVRFRRHGIGLYTRWWLAIFAGAVCIGMSVDYIDNMSRSAAVFSKPFYGPGFVVGAIGAALLLVSLPVSWRIED